MKRSGKMFAVVGSLTRADLDRCTSCSLWWDVGDVNKLIWSACVRRPARSICQGRGGRIRSMPLDRHRQEHTGPQMEPALWPVSLLPLHSQIFGFTFGKIFEYWCLPLQFAANSSREQIWSYEDVVQTQNLTSTSVFQLHWEDRLHHH